MIKKLALVLAAILLCVFVAACSAEETGSDAETSEAEFELTAKETIVEVMAYAYPDEDVEALEKNEWLEGIIEETGIRDYIADYYVVGKEEKYVIGIIQAKDGKGLEIQSVLSPLFREKYSDREKKSISYSSTGGTETYFFMFHVDAMKITACYQQVERGIYADSIKK